MGKTRHDTEMHGNNRLPPIDRMTVSLNRYCIRLRLLGKILFVIVLPISGSCQSMVYRSVTALCCNVVVFNILCVELIFKELLLV